MATRPKRICRKAGCSKTHRNTHGFCDDHQKLSCGWNHRQDRKGSTTARGYGHQWRLLREEILKRDRYQCQQCRREGRLREASHVDHIIPKFRGGTDIECNLQALCVPCHEKKTANER